MLHEDQKRRELIEKRPKFVDVIESADEKNVIWICNIGDLNDVQIRSLFVETELHIKLLKGFAKLTFTSEKVADAIYHLKNNRNIPGTDRYFRLVKQLPTFKIDLEDDNTSDVNLRKISLMLSKIWK